MKRRISRGIAQESTTREQVDSVVVEQRVNPGRGSRAERDAPSQARGTMQGVWEVRTVRGAMRVLGHVPVHEEVHEGQK